WVTEDRYSEPWAPRGMDFDVWLAIISPVSGMPFWWLAGRGIDAIIATRKMTIFPRIRTTEVLLATIWTCFSLWMVIASVHDLRELENASLDVLGIGGALWALLGSITIAAFLLQWRARKERTDIHSQSQITI